jgi:hypothetical protein
MGVFKLPRQMQNRLQGKSSHLCELRGLLLFLMEQTSQVGQLFMPVFEDELFKLYRNHLRFKLR